MASKDKKPARSTSSGSRAAGGIRTLADLNRHSGHDSDSDSDGAPQQYYTGGEKSGMLVQAPPKGHDVDEIFNQARQQGAAEGPPDNLLPSSLSSFTGTGRTLNSGEAVRAVPSEASEPAVHNIVFWSNGFSINDGPLRRLADPENAPFLESIRKSECPKEFETPGRRTPVHVNLIRRAEKYPEQQPEQRSVAFQGVGRTLGGSSSSSGAEQAAAAPLNTVPLPLAGLVVDQNQPSTPLQLRLADGTRMVAQFNYHHTIGDIRSFIDSSRPDGSRTYQLQSVGFPPKPLTDLNQTIEQAGLANSVVIQKR